MTEHSRTLVLLASVIFEISGKKHRIFWVFEWGKGMHQPISLDYSPPLLEILHQQGGGIIQDLKKTQIFFACGGPETPFLDVLEHLFFDFRFQNGYKSRRRRIFLNSELCKCGFAFKKDVSRRFSEAQTV